MTSAEKKELATEFLSEFEDPDPVRLATMVANDFEWKVMTRMAGMPPVKGHEGIKTLAKVIKTMMPRARPQNRHDHLRRRPMRRAGGVEHHCGQRQEIQQPLPLRYPLRRRQDCRGARVLRYQSRARGFFQLVGPIGRAVGNRRHARARNRGLEPAASEENC